ncbi:hypothetical protein I310019A7_11760 [Lawsonibacter asaccharolyticus]
MQSPGRSCGPGFSISMIPPVLPEQSESDPMGSYPFFRVKKIPTIAAIRMMGAALTNSHSNP